MDPAAPPGAPRPLPCPAVLSEHALPAGLREERRPCRGCRPSVRFPRRQSSRARGSGLAHIPSEAAPSLPERWEPVTSMPPVSGLWALLQIRGRRNAALRLRDSSGPRVRSQAAPREFPRPCRARPSCCARRPSSGHVHHVAVPWPGRLVPSAPHDFSPRALSLTMRLSLLDRWSTQSVAASRGSRCLGHGEAPGNVLSLIHI